MQIELTYYSYDNDTVLFTIIILINSVIGFITRVLELVGWGMFCGGMNQYGGKF